MSIHNLSTSLIERERSSSLKIHKKIKRVLEDKTATKSCVNVAYHTPQPARSTFVITFSSDKTKVATSHGNHTIKISDCFTCKVLHTLTGHIRTSWCVSFHPRFNSILASGCLGGEVRLWNLKNIHNKNIVYQSQTVIAGLTFHPVDDILVIGTSNRLLFYNWNSEQMLHSISTKSHTETIRLVRFLPDGSKLMTGIANTSKQYCKRHSLNVSRRGDPLSGQGVVETVSCMRIQRRNSENGTNENESSFGKRMKLDLSSPTQQSRGTTTTTAQTEYESSGENSKSRNSRYKDFVSEIQYGNSTKLQRANLTLERRNFRSTGIQTDFDDDPESNDNNDNDNNASMNINISSQNTPMNEGNDSNEEDEGNDNDDNDEAHNENDGDNANDDEEEVTEEENAEEPDHESEAETETEDEPGDQRSTLSLLNEENAPSGRRVRSEIWNFTLGDVTEAQNSSSSSSIPEQLGISVESATSSIPVHGILSFPSTSFSTSISDLGNTRAQRAVATATARSSHHVHTAVVIASEEDDQSEVALETAVNRAIAGAFAGSGEAAVANNIIDTTHRLQLWDSNSTKYPEISNDKKNILVPSCKIHNDASVDVSYDGTLIGVFVPSEYGFPVDAELRIISLRKETYGQCVYSRKYGPNAVSVSFSPLDNFVLVGLASRKLDWQITEHQLIGQVLKLPEKDSVVLEDIAKPLYNVRHTCNRRQPSNVSVNSIRFHPMPGMGIIYGTNRGHIQHFHIGPSLELNDPDMMERWKNKVTDS